MTVATDPRMTLKDYLTYEDGTETRYELEDGVLIEMGAENPLNPQIASFLLSVFFQLGVPIYRLVIGHQIGVSSTRATARQPDLMVHSEGGVGRCNYARWKAAPVQCSTADVSGRNRFE